MSERTSVPQNIPSEAAWYRGDFHAHTHFSDGEHSPAELLELASAEGLDFVAITDHHSIGALGDIGEATEVLPIPGIEVTFLKGHFNVFGVDGWSDWMEGFVYDKDKGVRPSRAPSDILRQTAAQGLLNSINHPLLAPWEWRDGAADMGDVHCVEVWNDPSWPDNQEANPQALELWTAWLNAGHRITAIGGSDYHRAKPKLGEDKPPERLGYPSTFVFAARLTKGSILDGLRRHRAYVSLGPRIDFKARRDARVYDIGSDLGEQKGTVTFMASIVDGPATARARLVRNGEVLAEVGATDSKTVLQFQDRPNAEGFHWYRIEVPDENGGILAFTNPIFAGTRAEPAMKRYDDFLAPSVRPRSEGGS